MKEPDIDLTEEERLLLSHIAFNWANHEELRGSLKPMGELAACLLERGAIPAIRICYFNDASFNPGGRGKSREDVFEKNGTSGENILCHPHFLKHFKYFLFGPELPTSVIEKFQNEASCSGHLTCGDINELTPYARSCVRKYNLVPHDAADEFYKLSIECGAIPSSAAIIRSSVRAVKTQ
ncbi:hypothetical protein [Thalassolituus sp.]|jgi:hypothetical protein|uniref:hypothetical protein n=1 Tax=Thalassolituus sp. TaxID=2030822 RepID=UPI002A825902|nr:hypothetical protein [Thalassolituus sp.]